MKITHREPHQVSQWRGVGWTAAVMLLVWAAAIAGVVVWYRLHGG